MLVEVPSKKLVAVGPGQVAITCAPLRRVRDVWPAEVDDESVSRYQSDLNLLLSSLWSQFLVFSLSNLNQHQGHVIMLRRSGREPVRALEETVQHLLC